MDGMGDRPLKELNNQTPLQAANTPNMDKMAKAIIFIDKSYVYFTIFDMA